MGKTKKQQLAEELNNGMTAVVINVNQVEDVDDETRDYDVLENLLERKRAELNEMSNMLNKTRRELTKNNRRLEQLDNECQEAKRVADKSVKILKKQLFKWLSKRSQHKVENILGFYHQEEQMELLNAMMTYAMTGNKAKLDKPVAQWHFRLFCEMMDEDRVTVPSHTLLKRLWIKIGLLKRMGEEDCVEVTEVKE